MEEQNSIYLQRLCTSVKQVQIEASQTNEYLVKDGRSPLQLCGRYEDIFCHRYRISTFNMLKKKPGFWGIVKEISRKEALVRIKNLQHPETDLGRCRAWIRLASNENSLVAYISALQSNPDLLAKYYEPQAFLRDRDLTHAAANVLSGLEAIRFELTIDTASLEVEIAPDAYVPADKISRIMALELARASYQQPDPILIERKPLRKKRKKPKILTSQSPDTDSPDLPNSESSDNDIITKPLFVGTVRHKVGCSSSLDQSQGFFSDSGFQQSSPNSDSRGFGLSSSAPGPRVVIPKKSTSISDKKESPPISPSMEQIDEVPESICVETNQLLDIELALPQNDTSIHQPVSSEHTFTPPPVSSEHTFTPPPVSSEHTFTPPPVSSEHILTPPPDSSEHILTPPPDSSEHILTPPPVSSEHILTPPPDSCLTDDQKGDFTPANIPPEKLKSELKLNLFLEEKNDPLIIQTETNHEIEENQDLSENDYFIQKSVSEPNFLERSLGAKTDYGSIENSPILEHPKSPTNYKDFPSPFNPNPSLSLPVQTYLSADIVHHETSSRLWDRPNSVSANSHSSDEFHSLPDEWDVISGETPYSDSVSIIHLDTRPIFQEKFHDDYFMEEINVDKLNQNEVYSTMRKVKEELKSIDTSHPSYKILVHTLVKLRIRRLEIDDGKVKSKGTIGEQMKVFGHIFLIHSGKNQAKLCEVCGKNFTSMNIPKNKWGQCKECDLTLHIHCIRRISSICPIQSDPKLILHISPEIGLLIQKFKCKNCSRQIGIGSRDEPKLCRYSGYYYCINCYSIMRIAIPAKIVHNWDFTPRGVSLSAYLTLKILYSSISINLTKENPLIYSYENTLSECANIRDKLSQMNLFLSVCQDAKQLGLLIVHQGILHDHIWNGVEPWSIEDLYLVKEGSFLPTLKDFFTKWDKHIRQCPRCSGNGHFCLVCNSEDIIFPWDTLAISCGICGMLSHSNCTTEGGCSRCSMRARRMDNVLQ